MSAHLGGHMGVRAGHGGLELDAGADGLDLPDSVVKTLVLGPQRLAERAVHDRRRRGGATAHIQFARKDWVEAAVQLTNRHKQALDVVAEAVQLAVDFRVPDSGLGGSLGLAAVGAAEDRAPHESGLSLLCFCVHACLSGWLRKKEAPAVLHRGEHHASGQGGSRVLGRGGEGHLGLGCFGVVEQRAKRVARRLGPDVGSGASAVAPALAAARALNVGALPVVFHAHPINPGCGLAAGRAIGLHWLGHSRLPSFCCLWGGRGGERRPGQHVFVDSARLAEVVEDLFGGVGLEGAQVGQQAADDLIGLGTNHLGLSGAAVALWHGSGLRLSSAIAAEAPRHVHIERHFKPAKVYTALAQGVEDHQPTINERLVGLASRLRQQVAAGPALAGQDPLLGFGEAGEVVPHGSGLLLLFGGAGFGLDLGGGLLAPIESGLNPIRNTGRQRVWPKRDGGRTDADCSGCLGRGAAQEGDGFGFVHAPMLVHLPPSLQVDLQPSLLKYTYMKTLAERTQEAIDAGFTVGALADAAGKSSSAVSQWLSGSTKSIKSDSAVGLQRLTGWSAEWWITGKGDRGKTTAPSAPPQLTLGAVALRLAMVTAKLDLRDRRAIADSLVYMLTEGGPSEKEASAIDLRSQQLVNLAGFVGDIDRSDIATTPQDVLAAYQQLDADGRLAVLSAIRKATEEDEEWGQQNIGTLANKTGRKGPKDERPNSKSRGKPSSTGSRK